MRIAVIQRFLPSRSRGGAGHFTHGLACALSKRGHEVTVFSEDPAPEGSPYKVRRVGPERPSRISPLLFPFRIAKENFDGFDVISAQGDNQWLSTKVPVLRTMHGTAWQEALHNGLFKFSPKHFLLHLYFYAMEWIAALRSARVVGVSRDTGRYYAKFDGVIPNGIDLEAVKKNHTPKSSMPTVLFVGELDSRKRGRKLAEIFQKEVKPAVPDAVLWMVSPQKFLAPGVQWFADMKQEDLERLYKGAWVFCLPSAYEGFGRGYAEALAAGTAVAATPNPGSVEVLEGGQYGVIAPLEKIGESLTALLKNAGLRHQYEKKGLERAAEYGWERVGAEYERHLRELAG